MVRLGFTNMKPLWRPDQGKTLVEVKKQLLFTANTVLRRRARAGKQPSALSARGMANEATFEPNSSWVGYFSYALILGTYFFIVDAMNKCCQFGSLYRFHPLIAERRCFFTNTSFSDTCLLQLVCRCIISTSYDAYVCHHPRHCSCRRWQRLISSLIPIIWELVSNKNDVLGKTDVFICATGILSANVCLLDMITMVAVDAGVL
ncbi:hypothetical protein BKA58DRAFT_145161 [Alternaria rosae]|uniref:uncharacterized protein n=1 Tax=Alternaria rosae TaxID=1187941 RepID=UPI001E8CF703|nr:uncharacterized protein BKA58DRAFT_145161 [Alternaria rosae]KAH6872415.1 hypothetical protein BKA58DRAFT_145161 [Alternaria rosae]